MPLLNYTTQVSVEKTVGEIHQCLQKHHATTIRNDYEHGELVAIYFAINVNGRQIPYRLPTNWKAVYELLPKPKRDVWDRAKKDAQRRKLEDQARRVAWRIIKDWVEAQMAIIDTNMVTVDQVFLPYMLIAEGQTVYDRLRERQFALPPK